MKEHIEEYKKKLEKGICDYMQMPISERSANSIHSMMECLEDMDEWMGKSGKEMYLTKEDAEHWNAKMVNDDGTSGGHWTVEQTTAVAESIGVKFEHITPYCWNVTMNSMYSDYCEVATKYGVGTAEFYADMAKAFLFDKDYKGAPKGKLAAYYHCIVK